MNQNARRAAGLWLVAAVAAMSACTGLSVGTRPSGWSAPEVLVPPSAFAGVHGLAVDAKGRLLAGSVAGNAIWEVDRTTGQAGIFIGPPDGQADDIAIGPRGEMAWTSFTQGVLRYREKDGAAIRVLAKDLPGINSLAFDLRNGRLYASQVFLGDALWEIDVAGAAAPRLIRKDLGGLNGFEVGPDGMIYGPLWFKGQVVKVDPADGAITVINGDFKVPAAANLDGKGNLWVVDTLSGEFSRVDLASGRKTVVRQLAAALDNLAVAPDGTIYVSNFADNSVQAYHPQSGEWRTLTSGKLSLPGGIELEGDTLWVADLFAFRRVDVRSGEVRTIHRMHASDLEYPFTVALNDRLFALSSVFTGSVHLIDRATFKTVAKLHGLKAPTDALLLRDGSLAFIEIATGTLTRAGGADYREREVIAQGLAGPVQMIQARDGALYVIEAAGRLVRIDPASGAKTLVADQLALPKGVAQTPWGTFIVAEGAARRLVEIDAAAGTRRVVAEGLPITPTGSPPYPTGLAVAADGTIYMTADANNALYRLRPSR